MVFVIIYWALRLPYLMRDHGIRERFRIRMLPADDARANFERSLETSGYMVIPPHPLAAYALRRFRTRTALIKWMPVVIGLALYAWVDLSSWLVGGLLASYLVFLSVTSDLMLTANGHRPFDGERTAIEWRTLGPAICLQFAGYAVGFATGLGALARWGNDDHVQSLAMMVTSVLLLSVAHLPVRFAVRLGRRQRPPVFAGDAPANSGLYLRPFTDDRSRIAWPHDIGFLGSPWTLLIAPRFEELLSVAVVSEGPMLAIGRPGEPLPELGASRTYWPDTGWQDAVANTAHRVARVVVVAGLTAGISWELERLRSWDMLRKTLVLLPPMPAAATVTMMRRLLQDLGIDHFDLESYAPDLLVAIGFSSANKVAFFTSSGRTWGAYFGAIQMHSALLRGEAPTLPG